MMQNYPQNGQNDKPYRAWHAVITSKLLQRWASFLMLIGVLSLLTACDQADKLLNLITTPQQRTATVSATSAPTASVASTKAAGSGVSNGLLLEILITGGLCPYGACRTDIMLNSDGTYVVKENKAVKKQGTLDKSTLATLVGRIAGANFAQIKSKKFTGRCPTDYDGSKLIYTFYTGAGTETIDSCQTQIASDDPLFIEIDAVRALMR